MSIVKVSAKIDRTDSQTPWGFRMAGGKDYNAPLVIQRVNPGSLSSKCGIRDGDTITNIAGCDVAHLTHREAQDLIIGCGNLLELNLERSSFGFGNDHFHQPSQPASLPWQQQQHHHQQHQQQHHHQYKPSPGTLGFAPKPFQKPSAVSTITSHMANFNLGGSPSSPQDHNLPWLRKSTNDYEANSYGSTTQHFGSGHGAPNSAGAWRPKVPVGERKVKVGRPGQAQRKTPTAGASRVPICTSCNSSIRGPFISALDKTWCPNHFVCANPECSQPLFDCGFVEEADQLYCERDYEKYLAPHCGKCSRPIVGEVVNAMKNTYHMHCFVCVACHQPIGTGSFHNEDGKIYCSKDWGVMFQTKCYGCQFPIEPGDKWVEALSQNWHTECFNCSTCQINLEGQPFCNKGGKPYCKKHGASRGF